MKTKVSLEWFNACVKGWTFDAVLETYQKALAYGFSDAEAKADIFCILKDTAKDTRTPLGRVKLIWMSRQMAGIRRLWRQTRYNPKTEADLDRMMERYRDLLGYSLKGLAYCEARKAELIAKTELKRPPEPLQ